MGSLLLPREDIQPSYANGIAPRDGPSANPGLLQGLVGAWVPPFGATGETLRDVSGRGNHGTLTNMQPGDDWVASRYGPVLDFSGVPAYDYVACPHRGFSVTECTVVTLFRRTGGWSSSATDDEYLFQYGQSNAVRYVLYLNDDGKLRSLIIESSAAFAYSSSTTWADQWYCVVAGFSPSQVFLWVDGVEQISAANNGREAGTISSAEIAGDVVSGTSNYFTGKIAITLYYDRVLSESLILQLSRDPFAPFRLAPLYVSVPDGAPPAVLDADAGSVSVTGADATFVHVETAYSPLFYNTRDMTPLLQM